VTRGGAAFAPHAPATMVLIAINVAVFLAEIASGPGGLGGSGNSVIDNFGLKGNAVADGEWYRLLTGGFLHAGIAHIGFNMFALFILGRLLEPAIGTPRYVALYIASLFAGAFGALALTDPGQVTVGASGAIFGLFGAAFVIARGRGFDQLARELGVILLINLALTFGIAGISIGGHLGGLAGGFLCSLVIVAGERGRLGAHRMAAEIALMAAIAVASIGAAAAVA
jgi:membrane associated rhomboid family serine protease